MYQLTREQKLANLKETYQAKYQKYKNLESELRNLQVRIQKLQTESTTQNPGPGPKNPTQTPVPQASYRAEPLKLGQK